MTLDIIFSVVAIFFAILDDGMDIDSQLKFTHIYKTGKHTCESLEFQIEVCMPPLEAVKVH